MLGVALLATGCGGSRAPAGTWSNDDGASVTVSDAGRVVFENIPFYDSWVSCTDPVRIVSGAGGNIGGGEVINVMLDDPIDLDPLGESREVAIGFSATGPGWDVWREIGTGGCDTDAPATRLQRSDQ